MIEADTLFVIIFGGAVILTLTFIFLWHVLHFILCKKYDALLFKEPYFRAMELGVYGSWPLSLFRSMGYILLLGVPSLATKRRFKGVALDHSNDYFLVLFCRFFLLICALDIIFVFGIIIGGVVSSFQ